MVCTTVILLVVLCFICFLVFLRKNDRPKTQKKEGFTENSCNRDLSCSPGGEVKHTIYLGDDRREKSGCCKIQNQSGRGEYFTENGCEECPIQLSEYSPRLKTKQPTKIDTRLVTTSDQNTILSCYAICESEGSKAPYNPEYGMAGGNYYDTDKCSELTYYDNISSNLYLETLSREISSNQSCSNITTSNAYNSNTYCCSNDTWLRFNSKYKEDGLSLQCCPANEYLNDAGSCSPCPKGGLVSSNDASNSGISACYIKKCTLGPATAYYNDTTDSGYNCYSNYYYYESTASSTQEVVNTISERSNAISYDGSNYFYPHSSPLSSNSSNTINTIDFDTTSNWFYDHGENSNHNSVPSSPDLTTTSYTQQLSYSNYYQCEANKFLRCETSPAPAVRSCICCSSNEYNSNAAGSCKSINSNTHKIADSNLKRNIKGSCNPGWGKSNNECVPCDVYEFSAGGSNICQRCPHGQYPKSDQSACEDADGNLSQSNYRIKEAEASGSNYLHYNDSNVFVMSVSNQLQYTDSNNMYVWKSNQSSTSTPTKYYLQVDQNFLTQEIINNGASEKNSGKLFDLIPYCPAGQYADEDSCSNCPAGTWSSTAGLEASNECSPCPAGTYSTKTGRTSNCAPCEAGYMCTNGQRSACSALSNYQDLSRQSDCKPIESGHYKTGTSNTSRGRCPAGYKCTGNGELESCSDQNKYQPYGGRSNCLTIPEGWYKTGTANTRCLECPVGHMCTGGEKTVCSKSSGRYQHETGKSNCHHCNSMNGGYFSGSHCFMGSGDEIYKYNSGSADGPNEFKFQAGGYDNSPYLGGYDSMLFLNSSAPYAFKSDWCSFGTCSFKRGSLCWNAGYKSVDDISINGIQHNRICDDNHKKSEKQFNIKKNVNSPNDTRYVILDSSSRNCIGPRSGAIGGRIYGEFKTNSDDCTHFRMTTTATSDTQNSSSGPMSFPAGGSGR